MAEPGSSDYGGMSETQRNAIVEALLAQAYQQQAPAAMYGDSVPSSPYAYPTDPSDPDAPGYEGVGFTSNAPGHLADVATNPEGTLGAVLGNPAAGMPSPSMNAPTMGDLTQAAVPGDFGPAPASPGRSQADFTSAFNAFDAASKGDQIAANFSGRFGDDITGPTPDQVTQAEQFATLDFDSPGYSPAQVAQAEQFATLDFDSPGYSPAAAPTGNPTGNPASTAVAVGYGVGLGLGDVGGFGDAGGFGGATGDGTSGGFGGDAGGPGVGGASTGISGGPGGTGEGGANTGEGGVSAGLSGAGEGGGGAGGGSGK